MKLKEGEIVLGGACRVGDRIHSGRWTEVWRATEIATNRQIVLEVIRDNLADEDKQVQRWRFANEFMIGERLAGKHVPNVVSALVRDPYAGPLGVLAFKFMPDGDLETKLKGRRGKHLSVDKALSVAHDLLRALDHVHSQDIIHQDIKPSNILLDVDGNAHLADFGAAYVPGLTVDLERMKQTGKLLTLEYKAPEQDYEDIPREPTDLYGVGLVLFEMLTGLRYCGQPGTLVSQHRYVERWLDMIVAKALMTDPAARYQSAPQMSRDIAKKRPPDETITSKTVSELREEIEELLRKEEALPTRVELTDIGMELCLVEAGQFRMASGQADANDSEQGDEWVHLDPYYIGRYPVTQEQYERFMRDTKYPPPFESKSWAERFNWDVHAKAPPRPLVKHPVVLVSCEDAEEYCKWAGLSLPTEKQWEKAARGEKGRIYPWGSEWEFGRCNSSAEGEAGTTPVGSYSPAGDSICGCADMSGNVLEWCAEEGDERIETPVQDSSSEGSSKKQMRTLRGGAWNQAPPFLRCTYRHREKSDYRHDHIGFRCTLSLDT